MNGSLLGTNQAVKMLDQRRLARTGMARKTQELATTHRQRHVAQRPGAAGVVTPEGLLVRCALGSRALVPTTTFAGAQRIAIRNMRKFDNGARGVGLISRGRFGGNGIRARRHRVRRGVRPILLGINSRDLGDHVRLAHLSANGHTLRTKRPAQAARRRHVQVELRELVRPRQDLVRRAEHGHAPRSEDCNAIGLCSLFHKVRNHHDGHTAIVERAAGLHKALAPARIEHRGRLVQDEHARLHGEHAGKRHTLFLPARERVGLVALEAHQPHGLQHLAHTLRNLDRFHPKVLGAKGNVVLDKRRHQLIIGILEHHTRGRADVVDQLGIGRVHAVDAHRSRIGLQQRIQMLGKCRLARPVATKNAEKLAVRNVQIDAVERLSGTVIAKGNAPTLNHARPLT